MSSHTLLGSQMNFPKLDPCKESQWFKEILNSSPIYSKGPVSTFMGGPRQALSSYCFCCCSLLSGHFCMSFITNGIHETGKWILWSVTPLFSNGISGKGTRVFMYQVRSYLFAFPLMSWPLIFWNQRFCWESALSTRTSPETKCAKAHAHKFASHIKGKLTRAYHWRVP